MHQTFSLAPQWLACAFSYYNGKPFAPRRPLFALPMDDCFGELSSLPSAPKSFADPPTPADKTLISCTLKNTVAPPGILPSGDPCMK